MHRECGITTVDEVSNDFLNRTGVFDAKCAERDPNGMEGGGIEQSTSTFQGAGESWFAVHANGCLLRALLQRSALPGCYYRDADFCFLDDVTGTSSRLFILTLYPHLPFLQPMGTTSILRRIQSSLLVTVGHRPTASGRPSTKRTVSAFPSRVCIGRSPSAICWDWMRNLRRTTGMYAKKKGYITGLFLVRGFRIRVEMAWTLFDAWHRVTCVNIDPHLSRRLEPEYW